jgi:hypothetical protein
MELENQDPAWARLQGRGAHRAGAGVDTITARWPRGCQRQTWWGLGTCRAPPVLAPSKPADPGSQPGFGKLPGRATNPRLGAGLSVGGRRCQPGRERNTALPSHETQMSAGPCECALRLRDRSAASEWPG